jgi:hypothetical protein
MPMGLTLQDIFCQHYPDYERAHPLPLHVRKAAQAIMQCRTAALGGHIQACPEGHFSRIWYNSCRHRACPQCAFIQTERWLTAQQARLLACDHYHVIFTLPHDLNALWLSNVETLSQLLFHSARDTLFELLGDTKYLGAKPGIMAALHTWSQTLVLHPHLHCLVTGGGINPQGEWVTARQGHLLPARVVMALFRGKMVAGLRRSLARDALTLPDGMRPQQVINLLNRLGHAKKIRWHVRIMERYRHGAGVATYLARYMRGGPLKQSRLVALEAQQVSFTYRVAGEAAGSRGQGVMRLGFDDFMSRLLLHVPPPRLRVVRSYGLYHASQGRQLDACRAQLGQAPVEAPEVLRWVAVCGGIGEAHPERCPSCGRELVSAGVVARSGSPPPLSQRALAA